MSAQTSRARAQAASEILHGQGGEVALKSWIALWEGSWHCETHKCGLLLTRRTAYQDDRRTCQASSKMNIHTGANPCERSRRHIRHSAFNTAGSSQEGSMAGVM
eukprot:scaffold210658_cov31-Tisochrysis_lutea.AAC.6